MNIDNELLKYFSKKDRFVLTTKYPYELTAVITNVAVIAIINDWRVAAKFEDVATEYARLKQIDSSLPSIDDLTYLMVKNIEDGVVNIIADAYIEDMYKL